MMHVQILYILMLAKITILLARKVCKKWLLFATICMAIIMFLLIVATSANDFLLLCQSLDSLLPLPLTFPSFTPFLVRLAKGKV